MAHQVYPVHKALFRASVCRRGTISSPLPESCFKYSQPLSSSYIHPLAPSPFDVGLITSKISGGGWVLSMRTWRETLFFGRVLGNDGLARDASYSSGIGLAFAFASVWGYATIVIRKYNL